MGRLIYFIKNDIKIILDKKFWRRLVFPLFLLIILSTNFSNSFDKINQIDKISIAVIDNDNTYYSKNLVNNFIKNENFSHLYDISTPEDILPFEERDLTAYIIIPKGFSEGLVYFENPPIEVLLNKGHTMKSLILKNTLDAYGDYISSVDASIHTLYTELKDIGYDKEKLEKLNSLYSVEMVFLALGRNKFFDFNPISEYPSVNSMTYFLLALSMVMVMYLTGKSGELLQFEKENGIYMKYRMYDKSGWTYISSKIISTSIISFCEIIPFYLFFDYILDIVELNAIFILNLVLGILILSSLSILISMASSNGKNNKILGNAVIFIFGILGGSFIPLTMIPQNILMVSRATPLYWINISLLNSIHGIYPVKIYLALGFFAISIFALCILIYRNSLGNYKEAGDSI